MSPTVQNPVSAVTGLIGYVTRRGMALTGRLMLAGISTGLNALESSKRAGETTRKYADTALQLASSTPLGRLIPGEAIDDGADAEAERIVSDVQDSRAADARDSRMASENNGGPVRPVAVPDRPAPLRVAQPEMSEQARQVGAPGAATAAADAAVHEAVEQGDIPTDPDRQDLPLSDFDSATLPSLRARLRSLSLSDLAVLREYEQAHAHRLPVITMLDNRIAKLAAESDVGAARSSAGSDTA